MCYVKNKSEGFKLLISTMDMGESLELVLNIYKMNKKESLDAEALCEELLSLEMDSVIKSLNIDDNNDDNFVDADNFDDEFAEDLSDIIVTIHLKTQGEFTKIGFIVGTVLEAGFDINKNLNYIDEIGNDLRLFANELLKGRIMDHVMDGVVLKNTFFIEKFYIEKEYRNKGYGKTALNLLKESASRIADIIILNAAPIDSELTRSGEREVLDRLIEFYKRSGYEMTDKVRGYNYMFLEISSFRL